MKEKFLIWSAISSSLLISPFLKPTKIGTVVKTSDLSTRRSQRAQSLRVFQSPLVFSDASALSARSAVKFGGIVISLENLTVPKNTAELASN